MVSTKNLESSLPVGILTGPTATGKSQIALELASQLGGIELINADSMLVYRGFDIGTAKPTSEELAKVPHHLIDICRGDEPFTTGAFKRAAELAIESIHQRGHRALIVGGTGFYLKSLLFGIWNAPPAQPQLRREFEQKATDELYQSLLEKDEGSALRIGPSDRYRLVRALELILVTGKTLTALQSEIPDQPDPRYHLWVIDRPNGDLHERIHERTRQMLDAGLISEFQKLHQEFPESRALNAIGYAQVRNYLHGKTPPGRKVKPGEAGLQEEIELATRQLVKQQRTWFRSQRSKVPNSKDFELDKDRPALEAAFSALYGDLQQRD